MKAAPTPDSAAEGSQRRHVAILFCDLSGSTRIAASMEPELYAELLQRLRERLDEIVPRHGGQIARIDGDGALCLFGYPDSHEDSGRRATEAAIDLHEAAAALDASFGAIGAPIRLHSGVHAGIVLLREGDIVRGRFEILGDATNVAARLCDHAGSGEIVVSETALGADRHFFRAGPRRQLRVAGHREPLAVVSIYGREAVSTRFAARTRRGVTPFTGREAELARLRAWLAEGPGGVVLVSGPPGIGKSRLVAELLAEATAAGVAVHRAYCESYLGARPLQPFSQLLASFGADAAAPLDPAPADGAEPGAALDRAIATIAERIAAASAAGPVILAIDDWQWADGASRETLEALAASLPGAGFLLASREPDPRLGAASAAVTIELAPLSAEESRRAIAALLPSPDAFLARRIEAQSGGSPLFLEELCHAPALAAAAGEPEERSAWLDGLIQARFASLPPDQAMLVRAASVIGHMIPAGWFAAMTGVGPGDPILTGLAEADFLFPAELEGVLRFKHGITRDAVYRTIGLRERQGLHARVVEVLRAEAERSGDQPLLEALAYHISASGDSAGAVPYAIRAGDAALAAGALDRAQAQYRSAFETVSAEGESGPLAGRIWPLVNKYGLACIVDPSPDQLPVMREMARRLRALGNARAEVRSEYWLGAIAYGLGEAKLSVLHLSRALRAAEDLGERSFVPQVQVKLAQSLFAAGRYAEADGLFDRLLGAVASGAARIDAESRVYALCCHGFLHADRGDFEAAARRYAEADAVLGDGAPPLVASYLTQTSAVCLFRGEWEQALREAEACLEACGRHRTRYQAMMARALGAYARWQIDGDPGAVEVLERAARWFAAGASQQRTSLVHGWLAEIMSRTGRAEAARRYAAMAVRRVHRAGDRLGEAMSYRAVARLAAAAGDRRRAARYIAAAHRSAELRGSARETALTRLAEAEIALAVGEAAGAAALLAEARGAFAAMGMTAFAERAERLASTSR